MSIPDTLLSDNKNLSVNAFPFAIKSTLESIHVAQQLVATTRERMQEMEDAAYITVCSMKAEGTDKPVYTNDKLRDIATRMRLADNREYTDLQFKLADAESMKAARNARYEGLRAAFRVALIDHELMQLGARDGVATRPVLGGVA